jgi:predicted cupin superfamily sugar epimerase
MKSGPPDSRPNTVTAQEVADALALQPHPEGGYFRETYRSTDVLQTGRGERSLATAILFLVAAGRPSRFHRLTSDETWIHQAGAPLELLLIDAAGALRRHVLGTVGCLAAPSPQADPSPDAHPSSDTGPSPEPQALVPAGTWQAARLFGAATGPGDWALMTCVVAPGFDYEDFELAQRDALIAQHPDLRQVIIDLT